MGKKRKMFSEVINIGVGFFVVAVGGESTL